jgi:hypothetical protein
MAAEALWLQVSADDADSVRQLQLTPHRLVLLQHRGPMRYIVMSHLSAAVPAAALPIRGVPR